MKSLIMFAGLIVAAVLSTPAAVAQQEQAITKRQVKQLLASATSPEDHQKLAAYFAQEADRLTSQAATHAEEAVTREKTPNYFAVKSPAVFGPQHCRDQAARLRRDAAKAETLAEQHREMARQATQ